ncbi:hypothetical protein [Clostridium sp. DL1XJH146]
MSFFKDGSKFERAFANIFRILLVLSAIITFLRGDYLDCFVSIFTLFLTFIPFILADRNNIKLPASYQIIILAFIFAAQYLGELNSYYYKFWWWDSMLHTFSGVILGFSGILLVYILNRMEDVDVYLSPFFVALFAFTFAVSIGALWEIFEFTMDTTFGLNMQKSGLVDTMWDLIVDSIGAIVAAVYGYLYERHEKTGMFETLFDGFKNMNPRLFTKDEDDITKGM